MCVFISHNSLHDDDDDDEECVYTRKLKLKLYATVLVS